MGDCPHCHVFSGVPTCPCCKTFFRIGTVLQSGKLSAFQESTVLVILRNCAGAISDVAEGEVSGPFGAVIPGVGREKSEEIGRSPLKEKAPEKKEEASKEKGEKETDQKATKAPEGKKAKKSKKDKTRTSRKEKNAKRKSRSRSTKRRSPEIGERKEEKRGSALESRGSTEAHTEGRKSQSPRSSRGNDPPPRREDRTQEDVDKEVRRDPARFGLGHVPIRGSAGGQVRGPLIPGRNQRPAEPAENPRPRRDGGEYQRYDNQGYGARGPGRAAPRWKGYNHVQRGIDYWKRRKSHW